MDTRKKLRNEVLLPENTMMLSCYYSLTSPLRHRLFIDQHNLQQNALQQASVYCVRVTASANIKRSACRRECCARAFALRCFISFFASTKIKGRLRHPAPARRALPSVLPARNQFAFVVNGPSIPDNPDNVSYSIICICNDTISLH